MAIVAVCCVATPPGRVRFGFGAVGRRPLLVEDDTGILIDGRGDASAREMALQKLLASASPISDLRAGADYRSAMLSVLARRALSAAIT